MPTSTATGLATDGIGDGATGTKMINARNVGKVRRKLMSVGWTAHMDIMGGAIHDIDAFAFAWLPGFHRSASWNCPDKLDTELRYRSDMERTKYGKEFKENAVRMSGIGNKGISEVAGELGIHPKMLYRWRREVGEAKSGKRVFPGNGRNRDEELMNMARELQQARTERDILKKAVTFFAQHTK